MEIRNIGIFGRRNAGKSSLINILAGQEVAIVDPAAGTTTDPVRKRMEIYGVGPCNLIDTAGIDDTGALGEKRIGRTRKIAGEVDYALIVFKGDDFGEHEEFIAGLLERSGVPFMIVHNFSDEGELDEELCRRLNIRYKTDVVEFSCRDIDSDRRERRADGIISKIAAGLSGGERSVKDKDNDNDEDNDEDKDKNKNKNKNKNKDGAVSIQQKTATAERSGTIMAGLVSPGDKIVFVCPIDSEAPAGRLILPQVMGIREVLDSHGSAYVVQPSELGALLDENRDVKMVITDSQAFAEVARIVPGDIPLGSFSILLARAKGPFKDYLAGLQGIERLKDGDDVLILESCTHRATCEDIGRVRIPAMLRKRCGCDLNFTFVAGTDDIPRKNYALAVQCGGCMVTGKILSSRIGQLIGEGIPVVNYGMAIAYIGGLFENNSFRRFMELL